MRRLTASGPMSEQDKTAMSVTGLSMMVSGLNCRKLNQDDSNEIGDDRFA